MRVGEEKEGRGRVWHLRAVVVVGGVEIRHVNLEARQLVRDQPRRDAGLGREVRLCAGRDDEAEAASVAWGAGGEGG